MRRHYNETVTQGDVSSIRRQMGVEPALPARTQNRAHRRPIEPELLEIPGHDSITLVGWTGHDNTNPTQPVDYVAGLEHDSQIFTPSTASWPVALQIRNTYAGTIAALVPVYDFDGQTWTPVPGTMAGGNYATGDSRFNDLVSQLTGHDFYGAVAIHDRLE